MNRMREDGIIPTSVDGRTLPRLPAMIAFERPRRDIGFHFVDQVAREAKTVAGIDAITANSYTVRSTISPKLQRAVEQALQEGLARFERNRGRVQFVGPEANLAKAVQRIEGQTRTDKRPAWQQALLNARLPLYDVHWTPAVVVEKPGGRRRDTWRVGLPDGRIVPISLDNGAVARKLALYDVVFTQLVESKSKGKAIRAELRVRPVVQGAVVVLENKTGRILAMSGGFSYPLSQLNRATQAVRQPGSAIKPLSYLAALGNGLQPNTLVSDDAITLPPIGGGGRGREKDYWTPKNYDGGGGGTLTLRRALENSRNLATAHLLEGGIADTPEASLDRLTEVVVDAAYVTEAVKQGVTLIGRQGDQTFERLFEHLHQGIKVGFICETERIAEIGGALTIEHHQFCKPFGSPNSLLVICDCLLGLESGHVLILQHVRPQPAIHSSFVGLEHVCAEAEPSVQEVLVVLADAIQVLSQALANWRDRSQPAWLLRRSR